MSTIFQILQKYTFDEKIKNLLINFERGVFQNFDFANCVLSCGDKSVNLSGVTNNKTIEENAEYFKLFYNFLVDIDFFKKKQVEKICENIEWKKQKRECKEKLIYTYSLKLKDKYNLSISEHNKLCNFINVHLKLNYITNTDISCCDGEISDISNIEFDEKTRNWICNYEYVEVEAEKEVQSDEVSKIYAKIDKYFDKK